MTTPFCSRLTRLVCFVLAVLSPSLARAQVTVEAVTLSTTGGTARGYIAFIDLTDPRVELLVTAPRPVGTTYDADLLRTDTWQTNTGATLAINANYFATLTSTTADIVGLSVSQSQVVSAPRSYNGVWDPAIVFYNDRSAVIGNISDVTAESALFGVAGVGGSATEPGVPGTLLITDGANTGATARVEPLVRNPRTALALNQAGTQLIACVIDGRQTGWSVGVTLPELADYLLSRGAYRAINLDGGGSSSFVYQPPTGSKVTNRPSDGSFRAVANHFGVKVNTTAYDSQRRIRGAWLRPPASLTTFEQYAALAAGCGIQDIFLETLYWGRDTANVGRPEFPTRFAFDYLAQAIPLAAKYGVRVHAWCETGYLDYGSSPSAFLQANPDFVVKHRDPSNTTTGDLADQRFVNLGNPGVRSALNAYFAGLTQKYPGLEGIQADYHFFPLASSGAAPWSYDNWAIAAFTAQYGRSPLTNSNTSGTTYDSQWLSWNRNNVTQALVQLRQAVDSVSTSPTFSAVAFADWSSATHRSKMIDLPSWGTTNAAEAYFVMSYFGSTSAIESDLQKGLTAVPGKRLVAGLANLTNSSRPSIRDQLTSAKKMGVNDFSWFDLPTFITNYWMREQLLGWLQASAPRLRGDFNNDLSVDARDWKRFEQVWTSGIVPASALPRADYTGDGFISSADWALFKTEFSKFRFGDDGIVDLRDITNLRACLGFTGGGTVEGALMHLYDLDGDGDVDYTDQLRLHTLLTAPVPPDTDVNRDGVTEIEDLYQQAVTPIDVNRDGVINQADRNALEAVVRAGELEDMSQQYPR